MDEYERGVEGQKPGSRMEREWMGVEELRRPRPHHSALTQNTSD